MWNNLFISYEINNSELDQSKLTSAIESLGNSTQIHENCWYVNSPKNASEAADLMNRVVSEDDIVIVANTTTDSATWLNLEEKREIRLKQNWKR
ncbi:hypothetical protein A3197_17505 [Candidatus Thiodiazotropha endoloripes]|nr:hypothetical protein A3197_17505 [Candidatus Thiodiazotropha endoloripes]